MIPRFPFFLYSSFLSFALATAMATPLPTPIKSSINSHGIPPTAYGLYVKQLGSHEPLVSVNADTARNPASAIKIVTTLAVLEILGPVWRWKTEVYTRGRISEGVLHGDLVFKGYGDPYLTTEELWRLLKNLRRKGIKQINGDILIDNSYFTIPHEDPAAFDNRPLRAYNVPPSAFMVNFKTAYFYFSPAANGRKVLIDVEPPLPNLKIENRLQLKKSGCHGYQRGIAMRTAEQASADHIIFEGSFPTGCREYVLARTALAHPTFAFGVIASLWQQLGGRISGQVGSTTVQRQEKPKLVWRSKPLADVIRLVNKFSNNVMTRQLLLTLGATQADKTGTVENGRQVIYDYLTQQGLDISSLHIDNGAGLSRNVRISPRLLSEILELGANSLFHAEFKSSLAIIGMDGTARRRLAGQQEAGHAHLKTGTIDHVSAAAGYVTSNSGKKYVYAAMINHTNAHRGSGKAVMNAIIRWLYRQ